jgi:hypothetical protein
MEASILTGPWDEWPMNRGSIPSSVNTRTYLSFPKRSDRLWGIPILPFKGYWGFFSQGWNGRGLKLVLPTSSAKVNSEWSYTSSLSSMPLWRAEGQSYRDFLVQTTFSKALISFMHVTCAVHSTFLQFNTLRWLLYWPLALTFKQSTVYSALKVHICVLWILQQEAIIACRPAINYFCNRLSECNARYEMNLEVQ